MSSKRNTTVLIAATLAVLAALALAGLGYGWRRASGPVERASARAPERITLYYTCDTRGHIEPCSCAEGIAGGVARRKAYLDAQPAAAPRLLVDAGNVTSGGRDWERVEMRYILEAYRLMGYDAVNAGHREATLNADDLREEARRFDRLISANLLDESGRPLLPPYRVADLPGGHRVGIVGVVDDTLPPDRLGKGLRIAPPEEALARYLPELQAEAPFIVLLAFADEERMKALAERFYEVDVIVGGDVLQPSGTPRRFNRSLVAYITDKGKGVGRLDLVLGPDGAKPVGHDIVVLTQEVAPDSAITRVLDAYKKALSDLAGDGPPPVHDDEEGLTAIGASTRSNQADTYIGAEACRDCHPRAYDVWANSAHAHAYATLASRGGQSDPECLHCHTVGYGATDGFVGPALTPHVKDVTCEACHGRGLFHARQAAGQAVPVKQVRLKNTECTVCHDAANSPAFDLASYWEKIRHDTG